MLSVCSVVTVVNLIFPILVFVTFPLQAMVDAKYGKSFSKEYDSRLKSFLIVCLFEGMIYLFGYGSGFLLGVCLP